MRRIVAVLPLLVMSVVHAQKKSVAVANPYVVIDKKALQIPDSLTGNTSQIAGYITNNFSSDIEKSRAAFIWIANNITYDVANMFALNFYESREDKVKKVLATRKGICENYAALFSDICIKAGLNSYVVEGYTKQNGFTDYIPHAWNAVSIDGSWYLFDPTWGSGYISNNAFVRKINNDYFKAQPASFIKSHMPFDYLWQFISYRVTNQEFYEGKIQLNKTKPFFSFSDSISAYEQISHVDQLAAAARRIEANGLKNALLYDRIQRIRMELEQTKQNMLVEKQNRSVNIYNAAVADYNASLNGINAFIQYRNNKFIPERPDADIQAMLDGVDVKLKSAQARLAEIKDPDTNIQNLETQLNKGIADIAIHLIEQQDWLKKYFSKGKGARKSMFYKYTWLGIPLN